MTHPGPSPAHHPHQLTIHAPTRRRKRISRQRPTSVLQHRRTTVYSTSRRSARGSRARTRTRNGYRVPTQHPGSQLPGPVTSRRLLSRLSIASAREGHSLSHMAAARFSRRLRGESSLPCEAPAGGEAKGSEGQVTYVREPVGRCCDTGLLREALTMIMTLGTTRKADDMSLYTPSCLWLCLLVGEAGTGWVAGGVAGTREAQRRGSRS